MTSPLQGQACDHAQAICKQKFATCDSRLAHALRHPSSQCISGSAAILAEVARVATTGRGKAALERAKIALDSRVMTLRSDAGTIADTKALAASLAAIFINAGATKFAAGADVDETQWDQIFNQHQGALFSAAPHEDRE